MKRFETATFCKDNISIDVKIDKERKTVWLSQAQIVTLLSRSRSTISSAIKEISDISEHTYVKSSDGSNHRPSTLYDFMVIREVSIRFKNDIYQELEEWFKGILVKENRKQESNIIRFNDNHISVDVKVSPEEDTVYLTKEQLTALFDTTRQNIEYHIANIYDSGELEKWATCKEILQVQSEGGREISRYIPFYNLDMIISIGFRVNSKRGIAFRKWANTVLKSYLAERKETSSYGGANINQIEHEIFNIKQEIADIKQKTFIEPIKEKVFFNGEYFDAYEFLCALVAKAKKILVIIDPFFDLKALKILTKVNKEAKKQVYVSDKNGLNDVDILKYNAQYGGLSVRKMKKVHDRFIIIDDEECYAIGASLNYAGKKTFAVYQFESPETTQLILSRVTNRVIKN